MELILYRCFLFFYRTGARIFSYWSSKARLWVKGREDVFGKLESGLSQVPRDMTGNNRLIWMHCASLGEFEQGRPVLEALKTRYPDYKILVTFFSPSGYEIRKNYAGADIVSYLPADSPRAARKFLELVRPSLVLWIKYEYWYFYLTEIKKRNTPLLLISGIFRPNQPFFKWYGRLHRKMLSCFSHFFVQNEDSKDCLEEIGISSSVTVSGDTRFDRVTDIAEKFEPLPLIEAFCESNRVIVAGSTWPEDEEELEHYANNRPGIRFIIAPHETGGGHIKDIERLFKSGMRYSELAAGKPRPANVNVLIIDNIGMLSRIYHYATITYVGGGFGDSGLHNVLEAAVYSKPVIIGPVYQKFAEAIGLLEAGGGFSVGNALALEALLDKLMAEEAFYQQSCSAAGNFVYSRKGATDSIVRYIENNRLPGIEQVQNLSK